MRLTKLLLGILVVGSSQVCPASGASLTAIDSRDLRRYEQTYEEWVQTLAQNIVPNIPATILVDFEYSNNPEDIQNYEELKAANHLPGLPDVLDPNFSYPEESPISTLVSKQRVKVILEAQPNQNQKKLLEEVLNTKLKLNRDRGDSLVFETINTLNPPHETIVAQPQTLTSRPITLSKNQSLALIAAALLGIAVLLSRRTQSKTSHKFKSKTETLRIVPTEQMVAQRLKRRHPNLFSRASTIINPLNVVLKTNPKTLVSVVRSEKIETLAQATLHAPEIFTGILMNICTQDQKLKIREYWRFQKDTITTEQSRFAQMLLAARIYRQSKSQSESIDPSLNAFVDSQSAQKDLKSQMDQQLKAIHQAASEDAPAQSQTQSSHEAKL